MLFNPPSAALTMKVISSFKVVFRFFEVRQDIIPPPANIAFVFPMVVIFGLTTHIDHTVNGRTATKNATPRIVETSAIQTFFFFGRVTPVSFGITHGEEIADRDFCAQIFIFATRLNNQNFVTGVL